MEKTAGLHIVELAAMKFYDNPNWEFELSAALPEGLKEAIANEIDEQLKNLEGRISKLITDTQIRLNDRTTR